VTAKRIFDVVVAMVVLTAAAPVLLAAMVLIFLQDGGAPLYRGVRVGRHGRDFRMLKLRSMRIDAERCGGSSTAASDVRITPVGAVLRRWKLDELPQFWNVLVGDMSVVGPRPNLRRGGVDRYTGEEMRLLTVRPGITDLSSIVFCDEADILDGAPDPDARYNAVIRPWKSRLGLLYVDEGSFRTDLRIMWLTVLAILAKPMALQGVAAMLSDWRVDEPLLRICSRRAPLPKAEPPGWLA
jgi:lipopolysaccharide/colanic/teichoic acid biosynthesis glycosyltransferase